MAQVKFSSTVNPNGYDTTAQFFAGETIDTYVPVGEAINVPAGDVDVPVEVTVELADDIDYVAKITATNEIGTVESDATEFDTDLDGLPVVGEVTVEVLS